MTRPAGALDSLVAEEVEISLGGMVNPLVHHGPRPDVSVPVLVIVRWEKPENYKVKSRDFIKQTLPRVVTLLDDDVGDHGLVVLLQLLASLSHGHQLLRQHRQELSLAHTVPVHDDLLRLPTLVSGVELDQEIFGDLLYVVDDLLILSFLLDPDLHLVVGCLRLHGANNGRNAGLGPARLRTW